MKSSYQINMDLALNHHYQVEKNEFTRAQPFDHNVEAFVSACLFGKQIGLTNTNRGNEV